MSLVRAMRPRSERAAAVSILGGLALLAIAAWAVTLRQANAGDALMMAGVPMSLEMGGRWGFSSAILFLLIWIVMMVAMMFPSVWPVVLTYAAVIRRRGRGSVLLFLAGYMLVWEGFGILAYAGYIGAGFVLASTNALGGRLPLLIGAVVIVAGLYQFTPLKRACLAHCQGPLEYLASHWQGGWGGALRMGHAHGAYCLGCCLGLMLALVALGVMDLRWMATVSAAIAVEKLGPRWRGVPALVGVGLLLLGIAIAVSLHPGAAGASAVRV
jgi:predicted metal-binding membrane protein